MPEEKVEAPSETPILSYNFDEELVVGPVKDVSGNENNVIFFNNSTYVTQEETGKFLDLSGTEGTDV